MSSPFFLYIPIMPYELSPRKTHGRKQNSRSISPRRSVPAHRWKIFPGLWRNLLLSTKFFAKLLVSTIFSIFCILWMCCVKRKCKGSQVVIMRPLRGLPFIRKNSQNGQEKSSSPHQPITPSTRTRPMDSKNLPQSAEAFTQRPEMTAPAAAASNTHHTAVPLCTNCWSSLPPGVSCCPRCGQRVSPQAENDEA